MIDFKTEIKKYPIKDILMAFPGMPPSTAYNWHRGTRTPPDWQEPLFLKLLEAHVNHSTSAHDGPSPETGPIPEWFLNWVLDNPIPKVDEIRDPIYEWLTAIFEDQNEALVEALPAFLSDWARKNLKKEALQANPDESTRDE